MSAECLPLGLLPVVLWCEFILEHSCPYRTHSPCHGSGSGCRTMAPLLTSDLSPSPASGVEPQVGRARSVQVQSGKKGSGKRGEERAEVLMECLKNCQCWDWTQMPALTKLIKGDCKDVYTVTKSISIYSNQHIRIISVFKFLHMLMNYIQTMAGYVILVDHL